MQILHVVPSYWPAVRYGGPIYSVHGLCVALAKRGHSVHVLTTNVDGSTESDVPLAEPVNLDGVTVRYFKVPRLRRLFYAPGLRDFLDASIGGFEVVHTHSVFLWPTWIAARRARAAGVPYVVSPRGMLVADLVRMKSRLAKLAWIALVERRNLEHAAAVHVTSDIEARELEHFSFRLRAPLLVIPNGVEWPESSTHSGTVAAPPFVLMLGRISWKKRIDMAIEALSLAPGIRLVIAGVDDERLAPALRGEAAARGVADRVEFVGPVDGRVKEDLLRDALALLMTSTSENFGNAVLEAMAMGTPALVVPAVGAAEMVRASGGGWVVEPTPEAVAAALRDRVSDPGARARAGAAGRAWVGRNATWDLVAARMESAYEEVISGGRRR